MRVKSPARIVLGCLTYILPMLLWIGSIIAVTLTDAFATSTTIGWVSIGTLLVTLLYVLYLVIRYQGKVGNG